MKKLIALLVLATLPSFAQFTGENDDAKTRPVRIALEKIFRTADGQALSPSSKLYQVVAELKYHLQADVLREDVKLIRDNIGTDNGPVARLLFEGGFNYNVLKYLRLLVNSDVTNSNYGIVDVATLMGTITGMSSAGVPMFERLGSANWKVNMGGVLELTYDGDIFWVLDRTRTMADEAIARAGAAGYSLMDRWHNDRFSSVESVIDFTNRVEAVLNQFQGFLISIQIKANQHQDDEKIRRDLIALKGKLAGEKKQFLDEITAILNGAARGNGDRTPWKSIAQSIASKKISMKKLEDTFREVATKYLQEADKITGNNKLENKYADDTPFELNASRIKQGEEAQRIREEWNKNAEHEYFKRNDEWPWYHYHNEENRGYTLQETRQIVEPVNYVAIPPILEEQDVIILLVDAAERLINGRPNHEQILELRADLIAKMAQHQTYMAGGPRPLEADAPKELRNGYAQRFQTRNTIIQKWLTLAIESTHRQEAHEKVGFLGLQYSSDLRAKYEDIIKKLEKTSQTITKVKVWTGIGAGVATGAGAACYFWLSGGGGL